MAAAACGSGQGSGEEGGVKTVRYMAYWELADGSFVHWDNLIEQPELQKQLVDKVGTARSFAS